MLSAEFINVFIISCGIRGGAVGKPWQKTRRRPPGMQKTSKSGRKRELLLWIESKIRNLRLSRRLLGHIVWAITRRNKQPDALFMRSSVPAVCRNVGCLKARVGKLRHPYNERSPSVGVQGYGLVNASKWKFPRARPNGTSRPHRAESLGGGKRDAVRPLRKWHLSRIDFQSQLLGGNLWVLVRALGN